MMIKHLSMNAFFTLVVIALLCSSQVARPDDNIPTPDSLEVQLIVQKGAEFLRGAVLNGLPSERPQPAAPSGAPGASDLPPPPTNTQGGDSAWSTEMLAALVCFHATGAENDPAVAKIVAKSIGKINGKELAFQGDGAIDIPVAIIFLSEVNLEKYRPQVQEAMQFLLDNQLANGAWNRLSLANQSTGGDGRSRGVVANGSSAQQSELADLEATQFAVFALWYAKQAGIAYPQKSLVDACHWLIRTQNQSAASARWIVASSLGGLKSNGDVRITREVARAGALVACADALGLRVSDPRLGELIPAAFRLANQASNGPDGNLASLQTAIRAVLLKSEREFTPQLPFGDAVQRFYTLYSFERLHSFRDHNLNRSLTRKVAWYASLVKSAKDLQSADGAFGAGSSRLADTALMCLALQRGLRFRPLTEGLLTGGRGLPEDSSHIEIRRGRVVDLNLSKFHGELMQLIAAEGSALDELLENSKGPLLAKDGAVAAEQRGAMLRALCSEDYGQRRKAIRVLSREQDLDLAPLLIFALSDSDREVVQFADEGLRRISRKLHSESIRENASDEERARHIEAWKKWYRNLRPDAVFIQAV